jgi:hypothetical protein
MAPACTRPLTAAAAMQEAAIFISRGIVVAAVLTVLRIFEDSLPISAPVVRDAIHRSARLDAEPLGHGCARTGHGARHRGPQRLLPPPAHVCLGRRAVGVVHRGHSLRGPLTLLVSGAPQRSAPV